MILQDKKLETFIKSLKIKRYISGPRLNIQLKPEIENKSGFAVFLTEENSIIKIRIRKTDQSFQKEIFFYTSISKKHPCIKRYIPKLINYSNKNLQYLEIEYIKDYKTLGSIQEIKRINTDLLIKLIETINKFHFKITKNKIITDKTKKIPKSTEKRLMKYFNINPKAFKEKINRIFKKNKYRTFITGDRNPKQILVNYEKNQIKLIDFNFCGIGNPSLDYTYLLLTLLPKYKKYEKLYLETLKKKYKYDGSFWEVFSIDIAFRCIDNYHFWLIEKRNKKLAEYVKKLFYIYYSRI